MYNYRIGVHSAPFIPKMTEVIEYGRLMLPDTDLTVQQVERNEGCTVIRTKATSLHCRVSLLHYHSELRYDHHVSITAFIILVAWYGSHKIR